MAKLPEDALVERVAEELEALIERGAPGHVEVLRAAAEKVRVALEELHVAEEELRQQDEQLQATQEELREKRRRYQDLFELAPDGYLETDLLGMIREANRAAGELLGLPPERLAGKPLALFVPPEDAQSFRLGVSGAASLDRPARWELHLRPRGGDAFPVSATVAARRAASGEPTGLRWLLRDATDEKRLEEEVRESERRLRTLADALPQLVWTARPDGSVDWCNDRAREYGPIERRADGSWDWPPLIHPEDRARTEEAWAKAVAAGTVYEVDHRVAAAEGGYRWLLTRAVPMKDEQGRVARWFGTGTDIGELKRVEEELREARDAARAGAEAKSQFLANMSHEIRTPLAGVLGMAEILAGTGLGAEQAECVDAIRLSGKLLLGVVNDILDLSRLESAGVALESVEFALRNALEDTVHLQAEAAHAKGLELGCLVGRGVPARVVGDPGRLRQILFNLVGNAVKFTERGQVVVRAERVEGAGEPGRSAVVRVEVEDSGIGIPEAAQKDLFQPFTQADASTTRRFGGSGLGLIISRRLVEAMGGEIGLQSSPGRGSVFWFTVPFRVVAGAPEVPQPLAGVGALVTAGHPVTRAFLGEQLARLGVAAEEASGKAEALELAARAASDGRPFGLALIDLDLPDGSGLSLARELGSVGAAAAAGPAPVLLVPFTSRGLGVKAQQEDGVCFLLKPVRERDLGRCLREVLAGKAALPAEVPGPEVGEAGPGPKAVLLAEDNPVNQAVLVGFLERLGCRVEVVGHGAAAVEAALATPYDLLLLDWQMPGMDGLEAAREIRRREGPNRRAPLVALTAHALPEHREQCLAAGMDDYLSKPVELADLARVLERWTGAGAEEDVSAGGSGLGRVEDRLAELVRMLAPRSVGGIVGLFLEQLPQRLASLAGAVKRADAAEVAREAHQLRGTICHLGTERMIELAAELERRAEAGELAGAEDRLAELGQEAERVRSYLEGAVGGEEGGEAGQP